MQKLVRVRTSERSESINKTKSAYFVALTEHQKKEALR